MFPKKTNYASEMLFSVAGLQAKGSCQPSTSNMRPSFPGTRKLNIIIVDRFWTWSIRFLSSVLPDSDTKIIYICVSILT